MQLIQVRNIFLYLFLVCFFFYPRFQTICIGLAFFMTFFTGEFKDFKSLVLKNKLGLAFIIFFIITLLSMTYTKNQAAGWQSIETKFAFIAFPLFVPLFIKSKKEIHSIFKFLNHIAMAYLLLSVFRMIYLYYTSEDAVSLTGTFLEFKFTPEAKSLHPTYVSFYFLTLILFNGNELLNNLTKKREFAFSILRILAFSIFIILLSSKVAFIGLFISVVLLIGKYAIQKGKIKLSILFFLVFSVIAIIGIYNSNLKIKFEQTYQELTNTNRNPASYVQSTGARIWFWKTTTEIVSENSLLGVGTGDIRDELSSKYRAKGIKTIQDKGFDSHQQYLQTFASLGVFGFVCLLSIFFLLFYQSVKHKQFVLFGFTLLYFIFGLTESMLETQAGIIFFTFFGLLLYSINPSKASD